MTRPAKTKPHYQTPPTTTSYHAVYGAPFSAGWICSLNAIMNTITNSLNLVDWTGKAIRQDKRGYISQDLPPILQRLNIGRENWLNNTQYFESRYWKALANKIIAADTG